MKSVNDISLYSTDITQPQRIRSIYQNNGFVLVRNAVPTQSLDDLVQAIGNLVAVKLQQRGVPTSVDGNLDANLAQLAAFGEGKVEMLLRASRETLAFHSLILSPALQELIALATTLRMPQIISETCMLRIDRSMDSSRDFAWHYDAAYTAQPPQAITCWIPLTPVDDEMGPLRVVPNSHKSQHTIRFHRHSASVRLAGPKRIELTGVDVAELESNAIDCYPMRPGDVILLHGWTLHRSGRNISPRARWVFNPRYGDLLDERVVANDWRVSRVGEPWVFAEYHPDLVKEYDDGHV